MRIDAWGKALNRYVLTKKLYLLGEETDLGLNTNLQPMNEFRAALDHMFRLIQCEIETEQDGVSNERDEWFAYEFDKLNSHMRRALFDVCDFLSIAYRERIIEMLKIYSAETIRTALPDYYSQDRQKIDKITKFIADHREIKADWDNDDLEKIEKSYTENIEMLGDIYARISQSIPSMEELHEKEKVLQEGEKRKDTNAVRINKLSLLVAIVAVLVAIYFGLTK